MATPNIVPRSDSEGGLGTASKYWASAYIDTITTTSHINLPDNAILKLGTGADLQIVHTGTSSQINNSTGKLQVNSFDDDIEIVQFGNDKDIVLKSDDGSGGTTAYITLDGSSVQTKFHKNTEHQDSVLGGYGNGMDLQLQHNATDSYIDNYTGDLYFRDFADDKDIIFQSDNGAGGVATYFYLDGSSAAHDGSATTALYTNWPDKSRISLGTSHDATIQHDGTNTFFRSITGNLKIQQGTTDGDLILECDDGSGGETAYITLDGSTTKVSIHKEVDFGSHINLIDNANLNFGAGNDLAIYHDGSNSYIAETGTGLLNIFSNGSGISLLKSTGENMGLFKTDGAVELYHDNAKKFETTATGIAVTGGITVTGDSSVFTSANANDPVVEIKNTTNDAASARLKFVKDRGAAAQDGDDIGSIEFVGEDDGQNAQTYGQILSEIGDATAGEESGKMELNVASHDGGLNRGLLITGGSLDSEVDVIIGNGAASTTTITGDLNISGDALRFTNDAASAFINGFDSLFIGSDSDNDDGSDKPIYFYQNNAEVAAIHLTEVTTNVPINITSATGNAAGAGFNTSGTVAINVGEINGEIITTIKVDIGTGAILSSGTAGDVIGEDDTEGAFLTRITTAVNGIVYRGEMICVEVPTTGDADINLAANSSATLAEDGAGEGEHVLIDGGTATLAKHYPSFTIPSGGIQNDHLYLTHGGTTAGTYGAGQFIIKLYGAAVVS